MARMGGTSKKLSGRAFYESLGSPKLVLAPMVDQSEFAWRMLTRSFMDSDSSKTLLAYTPMLHARLFAESVKYRQHVFEPLRTSLASPPCQHHELQIHSADYHLDGNPSFDRPLFVQFCANSPDDLLRAAQYVSPFCDAIDLNLGCPQGIARKGYYGAFLQENWSLIHNLISNLRDNLSIPVTAKIRVLETKQKTLDYAKMILSAGASIITVHSRQREQKGHNTGLADWAIIRYLREHLPADTVIFANGNILRHEDIEKCLAATGADAVMSAEGNLADPSIFAKRPPVGQEGREYWRGRDGKGGYRLDAVLRRYMDIIHENVLERPSPARLPLFIPSDPAEARSGLPLTSSAWKDVEAEQPPEAIGKRRQGNGGQAGKPKSPNLTAMQPHLFNLLRPLVAKHTKIRDALARCRCGDIAAFENVLQMVESVVKQGLIGYENNPQGSSHDSNGDGECLPSPLLRDQDAALPTESSAATAESCKQPWWICQPYVRPLPSEAFKKGAMTLSKKEKARLELGHQMEIPKDAIVCG